VGVNIGDEFVDDVVFPVTGGYGVRHPPRSGWLGEWGRLKGGCPVV
jgi:hypothetical protein